MIKAIVPISGGKDSQMCLELAIAEYGRHAVMGLFCDTGFEHDATYDHVEWMRGYYQVRIVRIAASNVPAKVLKYKRFPTDQARFCTDELKLRPTRDFLRDWGKPVEVWYGMRLQESPARAKRYAGKIDTELYAPHEFMPKKYPKYLAKMGIMFRLPILELSDVDVFAHLFPRFNVLYQWFDRVGCFPCLAAGDKYKKQAFEHDAVGRKHRIIVIALQDQIGKSIYTSKKGKADDKDFKGCAICEFT